MLYAHICCACWWVFLLRWSRLLENLAYKSSTYIQAAHWKNHVENQTTWIRAAKNKWCTDVSTLICWLYQEQKIIKQSLSTPFKTNPLGSWHGVSDTKPWWIWCRLSYKWERLGALQCQEGCCENDLDIRIFGQFLSFYTLAAATGLDFPYWKLPPLTLLVRPKWHYGATATGIQQLCIIHLISKAGITSRSKEKAMGKGDHDHGMCLFVFWCYFGRQDGRTDRNKTKKWHMICWFYVPCISRIGGIRLCISIYML